MGQLIDEIIALLALGDTRHRRNDSRSDVGRTTRAVLRDQIERWALRSSINLR
jgi:hypothetical protein